MLKKVLCLVMAMLVALPLAAFAGGDVTSDGMKFYKEYQQTDAETLYRELSTFESGNMCVGATVTNSASEEKAVKVLFATYSDSAKSELESVTVKSVTLGAGEQKEVKSDALKIDDGETVRAFLWADYVTPVISSTAPAPKTERVFADFEDATHVVGSAPAANNSKPERLAPNNVVVATDPEENGTRGKVLEYNISKGSSVQFNGFLNANVGISSLPANYTSSMEFDIFFPTAPESTFYIDLNPNDGGGVMKARLAVTVSGSNARVVSYYSSSNKYDKDYYAPANEFWGKWHHVKIEYSSAQNAALAETAIYFDGNEIQRASGVFGATAPSGNRFSISALKSTVDYTFYVDNVKLCA